MTTTERRRSDRIGVTIRPWLTGHQQHGIASRAAGNPAIMVDLSLHGARLEVFSDVAVGDRLTLAFRYRNRAFTLQAAVVRVSDDGSPATGPAVGHSVGVQFEDLTPLTEGRLASVLTHRRPLTPPRVL